MGDADSFARLVRRWHSRLLRHARYFTRDTDAAQDVAQDTWMAIVRGIRTLHDPARFRAWAFHIVANKSRDWVRREQARRRATLQVEAEPPTDAGASSGAIERVRAGLTELEPSQRCILTWYYLEEMSLADIAEALEIPVGTVKSRLFHARNALRARLKEA
jgi:RNA polymerase sigma-70 factor (ECF subfamily)